MDIHWIFFGAFNSTTIKYYYLDLLKDSRRARFYNWYNSSATRGTVRNEDPTRMWVMVF